MCTIDNTTWAHFKFLLFKSCFDYFLTVLLIFIFIHYLCKRCIFINNFSASILAKNLKLTYHHIGGLMKGDSMNQRAIEILNSAEKIIKKRGFNAFSYKDISAEVGVRTSSIHYYFPQKSDLAAELVKRAITRSQEFLKNIEEKDLSSIDKLSSFSESFILGSSEKAFCLCGMLISDLETLTQEIQLLLQRYFNTSESWIQKIISQGKSNGEIIDSVNAELFASQYLAALEGGMLISRVKEQSNYLESINSNILNSIKI